MRKKEKEPEWFWARGLHDAEVEDISIKEINPDYSKTLPLYNFLSIKLDAEEAMFERDITEIRFYNYKLKGIETKLPTEYPLFWMTETLSQFSKNVFEIKIELETADGKPRFIHMTFQSAEVIRKQNAQRR